MKNKPCTETKLSLFEKFDQGYPKFKWFIEKHFKEDVLEKIESHRVNRDERKLLQILNLIWFYLPDDEYNIMVNPPGWNELLHVITPE